MLYIGEYISKVQAGGDIVNLRNIRILKEVFNKRFYLINISFKSYWHTFINLLFGCMNGLSPITIKEIIKTIKQKKDNDIFLATSKLGKLAYHIKRENKQAKIWVFFHNIEKQYMSEEYKTNKTIKNWFISKVTAYNEKLSCKYGDIFIVLNNRDKILLKKFYNKEADIVLPTSFEDKYNEEKAKSTPKDNKSLNLLFVGSSFFANIEALNWFISRVFPYLNNCTLTIVGNQMDKHFKSYDNIHVYGYVEDLSIYYYKCHLVISPIMSGGGMKTKTAEALMYGCPIIGTKEAFEGYDINIDKIGACCNNEQEMIKVITNIQNDINILKEYSVNARKVYLKTYTLNASIAILQNYLRK